MGGDFAREVEYQRERQKWQLSILNFPFWTVYKVGGVLTGGIKMAVGYESLLDQAVVVADIFSNLNAGCPKFGYDISRSVIENKSKITVLLNFLESNAAIVGIVGGIAGACIGFFIGGLGMLPILGGFCVGFSGAYESMHFLSKLRDDGLFEKQCNAHPTITAFCTLIEISALTYSVSFLLGEIDIQKAADSITGLINELKPLFPNISTTKAPDIYKLLEQLRDHPLRVAATVSVSLPAVKEVATTIFEKLTGLCKKTGLERIPLLLNDLDKETKKTDAAILTVAAAPSK